MIKFINKLGKKHNQKFKTISGNNTASSSLDKSSEWVELWNFFSVPKDSFAYNHKLYATLNTE